MNHPQAGSADHKIVRTTTTAKVSMATGLIVVLILAAAPWWAGRADMRLMSELFLYLALASLWNLMAGYAGLVSVGQQAYVCLLYTSPSPRDRTRSRMPSSA